MNNNRKAKSYSLTSTSSGLLLIMKYVCDLKFFLKTTLCSNISHRVTILVEFLEIFSYTNLKADDFFSSKALGCVFDRHELTKYDRQHLANYRRPHYIGHPLNLYQAWWRIQGPPKTNRKVYPISLKWLNLSFELVYFSFRIKCLLLSNTNSKWQKVIIPAQRRAINTT